MEILGVGPSELIFIIIIAIIVLGPRDMQKAGLTIGRWLNQMRNSDGWKVFQATSKELRNLPTKLMREANIEDLNKDLANTIDPRPKPPASSLPRSMPLPEKTESTPKPESATPASDTD